MLVLSAEGGFLLAPGVSGCFHWLPQPPSHSCFEFLQLSRQGFVCQRLGCISCF